MVRSDRGTSMGWGGGGGGGRMGGEGGGGSLLEARALVPAVLWPCYALLAVLITPWKCRDKAHRVCGKYVPPKAHLLSGE